MSNFILVNPKSELIKTNVYTIPNLENYRNSLIDLLHKLNNPSSLAASCKNSDILARVDKNRLQRLLDFKSSELKYVESYLKILKNLDLICKTCEISKDQYDYEKEDEILRRIDNETKLFKKHEQELSRNKRIFETDGIGAERRQSAIRLEQNIETI